MRFGKRKQTTERQHAFRLEPAKLAGIYYDDTLGAITIDGYTAEDKLRLVVTRKEAARLARDLENAMEAWDAIESGNVEAQVAVTLKKIRQSS